MPRNANHDAATKPRPGSKALIREINEALVLDAVRAHGPVARARIATETGLSPATVTGITGKLLQARLLIETDIVRTGRGRPARLLDLDSEVWLAAGVRISASEAHAVLVTLRGEVAATHREAVASTDPRDAVLACARAVGALTAQKPGSALLGAGVAISGVVDQAAGIVRHSGSLGWEDVPFREHLSAQLDTPVVIDSYANCAALGLLLSDSRLEGRDLLVFSVGASLGASVVMRGRIHRGFNGTAGGFAHTRAGAGSGPALPCHCGATDCLETRASQWGIQRDLERRGLTPDDLTPGGDTGLVTRAGKHLGTAAANAAKLFGPERVVVAFTPEMYLPPLVTCTEQTFHQQYDNENTAAPLIELTAADPSALARGAAHAALARLFTADLPGATEPTRAAPPTN